MPRSPIAAHIDPPLPHCPRCGKLSTTVAGDAYLSVPKCDGRCPAPHEETGAGLPEAFAAALSRVVRFVDEFAPDANRSDPRRSMLWHEGVHAARWLSQLPALTAPAPRTAVGEDTVRLECIECGYRADLAGMYEHFKTAEGHSRHMARPATRPPDDRREGAA